MEKQKALLIFALVLNFVSWGQALRESGAIGKGLFISPHTEVYDRFGSE